MGNQQSSSIIPRSAGALDAFVSELGTDVVYDKSLGSSRFLKTVRCRHRNGYLVCKIFIKPDTNPLDERYLRRLKKEKKALQDVPNVYSYQIFLESDKAGYVVRQWVASSLYDRISTRPFLTSIEKKWIAFQILSGLREARRRKVSHGDIKSENILVTSWNWVYITDFSSYKPTFLPLDNPSDFAYFYDTSGRRNCYLAPERFYTRASGEEVPGRDGKVTEAMDVFSAGCVLAELFLEGTALFSLAQLFKYREGELDIDTCLGPIDDPQMRAMIKQMVALDPSSRPSFDTLLHTQRNTIFPECFYSPFYDLIASVNDIAGPALFFNTSNTQISSTPTASRPKPGPLDDASGDTAEDDLSLPNDSDRRIDRISAEFDVIEPCLATEKGGLEKTITKVDYVSQYSLFKPIQSIIPVVVQLPNSAPRSITSVESPSEDGPALIILSLICANLRNCCLPSSKLRALDMLLALSAYLTDEAKLDRLLPYVMELLHDEVPSVRAAALRTVLQVLALVNAITPFNADIFPQYVLPYLRYLTNDPEVSVRTVSAQSIVHFANLSMKYLEMGQALRAHGTFRLAGGIHQYDEAQYEVSYDASLEEIQKQIEDHLALLLVDQSSVVKRSVLLDIAPLCIFLERQKTNDVLLSHMITYLNDRDWLLRYAFFESIVDVAACLGGRNLEEYIFPLMTQALTDAEETNVAKVLSSLTTLCELGLFQKMRLWELMSGTLQLLYHPNVWVRQGACAFIASAAKQLPPTDAWCILYPSLKHFLRSDLKTIDVRSILVALKSPLSRQLYDFAADWALRAENTLFWKPQRKQQAKVDSPKEAAIVAARKSGRVTIRVTARSEEDDLQLSKLEQLGMSATEETKLVALKDYIAKFSAAVQSMRSRPKPDSEWEALQTTGHVELQKFGVVLHTVFLGSRSAQPETSRRLSVNRLSNYDYATGNAPFEDLRRRLATINGSNTSLNSAATNRDRRSPTPAHLILQQRVANATTSTTPTVNDLPQTIPMRPPSPTESIISTANSISLRPRFSVGSMEGVKAAPAVGSVRTNAVGLLEAPGRPPSEILNDRSGMTSPASFGNTIRDGRNTLPFAISEDGQDTTVNRFLEDAYIESNKDAQLDFGPRVHEGPVRRRNATRQSYSMRDPKKRHVEAALVSHLNAHNDAITGLAVSPDHVFFVSASDDKTVKIWDSARLERNVTSKPRHTYSQHHARVKFVCMLEGHHCFASAAEDGSLHVVRVHITQTASLPKYTKFETVRDYRVERPGEYIRFMLHYNTETSSNLVYATNHSMIVVLDLRSMHVLQSMENPRHFGPIVSFCIDRKRTWLVVASSSGVLSLWDLRFGLLLRNWKVQAASDESVVRLQQCVIHPSKGRGKWIMVSLEKMETSQEGSEYTLVEVWDVEKASLVERYISRNTNSPSEMPQTKFPSSHQPAESDYASAIARLLRSRHEGPSGENYQASSSAESLGQSSPTVTTMAPGLDFGGHAGAARSFVDLSLDAGQRELTSGKTGFAVVGTDDCKIKLWNLDRFERSVVLSDQETDRGQSAFSVQLFEDTHLYIESIPSPASSAANLGGGQRSSLITGHQHDLLKAHKDSISSIVCIDSPFRGGIISGDRSGVVKVWRVEGLDGHSSNSLYS